MIFVAIKWVLKFVAMLFIMPPAEPERPFINEHEPCPACGNAKGHLEFKRLQDPNDKDRQVAGIEHNCEVCKFSWMQPTLSVPEFPTK